MVRVDRVWAKKAARVPVKENPGIARENAANFDWAAGLSIDDLVNDLRERLVSNFFFIEVDTSRLAFYEPSPASSSKLSWPGIS